MAILQKKINPLDLKKSTAIGVQLPFSGTAVFNSTFTTKDAVRINLINYLLTDTNERWLNPTFGGNIRSLLFEQVDERTTFVFQDRLKDAITSTFPQIYVKDVLINTDSSRSTFYVTIKYALKAFAVEDEFTFELESNG